MSRRSAKKMIMVPETEYASLMSILTKSGAIDSLQSEKAKIETDMESTLRNPKLSEESKALKYQSLFKKRRKLKNKIENKPTNVFVTNQEGPSRTTGTEVVKEKGDAEEEEEERFYTPDRELPEKRNTGEKNYAESPIKQWYSLDHKYFEELKNLVDDNREKLGVGNDGRIKDYKNKPINNSDYIKSLEKIVNKSDEEQPKGFKFFISRLKTTPEFQALISKHNGNTGEDQTGTGKKKKIILVKTTRKIPIKLKNKNKSNPFKFVLWERI